jgi:hypothetical protein
MQQIANEFGFTASPETNLSVRLMVVDLLLQAIIQSA